MGQTAQPSTSLSIDDYLVLEQTATIRHELVDGQLYAMVGATDTHNLIVQGLAVALWYRLRGSGCRVFTETVKVRTGANIRYPDIFVTCAASDSDPLIKTQPVLIAEVLSDATRRRDWNEKRDEYLQVESLRHYLLLEQSSVHGHCWTRTDSAWALDHVEANGEFELAAFDCKIPLQEIYQQVWTELMQNL
jgi:Uma2 family endonuclease